MPIKYAWAVVLLSILLGALMMVPKAVADNQLDQTLAVPGTLTVCSTYYRSAAGVPQCQPHQLEDYRRDFVIRGDFVMWSQRDGDRKRVVILPSHRIESITFMRDP